VGAGAGVVAGGVMARNGDEMVREGGARVGERRVGGCAGLAGVGDGMGDDETYEEPDEEGDDDVEVEDEGAGGWKGALLVGSESMGTFGATFGVGVIGGDGEDGGDAC
jgi:hypothetical protein